MTRKICAGPGAQTFLQAKVGIVVAALFLVFGLVFAVVVLSETEGELVFLIGAFFIIWVVACLAIIVFYANLLMKRKNAETNSLMELTFEEQGDTGANVQGDFESRLRKLERLKKDGLITEKEYLEKRTRIMEEKW